MNLNTLKPAPGSKKSPNRLGRGIGSGMGKTCGRGHKGQRARAGGFHKVGFEGGQMPLQRRLPKFGFKSITASKNAEVRLGDLEHVKEKKITLQVLKDHKLVKHWIENVKIILAGKVSTPLHIQGLKVTGGARKAIESLGGKIEE